MIRRRRPSTSTWVADSALPLAFSRGATPATVVAGRNTGSKPVPPSGNLDRVRQLRARHRARPRVVSATKSQDVRFHQLEEGTNSRIRYRRVSEQAGEEVTTDRIVKGDEIEPGRYVVMEGDELEASAPKRPPDRDRGLRRPHRHRPRLLRAALFPRARQERREALPAPRRRSCSRRARSRSTGSVMRSKEALVVIRAVDGVLVLETMRYADEVLGTDLATQSSPSRTPPSLPSARWRSRASS